MTIALYAAIAAVIAFAGHFAILVGQKGWGWGAAKIAGWWSAAKNDAAAVKKDLATARDELTSLEARVAALEKAAAPAVAAPAPAAQPQNPQPPNAQPMYGAPPQGAAVMYPFCHSTEVQAGKRGWKWTTGYIGSGKIVMTCLSCGKKF